MRRALIFCGAIACSTVLCAQPAAYTNSIGMQFALAPAGAFMMGRFTPTCAPVGTLDNVTQSEFDECTRLARDAAKPGFRVTFAKPFYIGKFEVTQEQYQRVMGSNPSYHTQARLSMSTNSHPVDSVTWVDAQAFVKKLNANEKTGVYRLPTEAEWEYTARGGTEDDLQGSTVGEIAWYRDNAGYMTHPVGQKKPNAWGIYDMIGNVWEWVQDWYDEQTVSASAKGPARGKVHVLRGAAFQMHPKAVRVTVHAGGPGSVINVGFRIVREVR